MGYKSDTALFIDNERIVKDLTTLVYNYGCLKRDFNKLSDAYQRLEEDYRTLQQDHYASLAKGE
jgi:hypothetical protein